MKVAWGKRAEKQFFALVDYIKEDSELQPLKVGRKILEQLKRASIYPENYGLDKYRRMNDGTYRYFNKYSYRISYRVLNNGIKVLRLWHTKRKPSFY